MPARSCSLRELLLYFLRLGTFGFGGPIALTSAMHRDLVEARGWIEAGEYRDGLALAQLAPGPLAAQLATYVGWVRYGVWGATLVSLCFVLPSFLIVVVLAAAYVQLDGLPWMQDVFYGIGAAVIAIIAMGARKLVTKTLGRDRLLWALFVVNTAVTAWTQSELIWLVLASGAIGLFFRSASSARTLAILPLWLATGLPVPRPPGTLSRIFWYFAEAGAFVFGSGLAIVPFLHTGVVDQLHWLNERQFLDAVAVAMITPGPVVITVAFIGFLVAGLAGATLAALGVFLPSYLFVVIPAAHFRRFARNEKLRHFVDGVTAAAVGTIAGAAIVLAERALIDGPSIGVALAALAALYWKSVPEPAVIGVAGLAGLAIRHIGI